MIEELVKEMEEHIDSDDFEEIQEKCVSEIEKADLGIDAVEALLLFMERHPLSDFGIPGAIVHYAEQFSDKGYEELLIASVMRRPTLHTVWMLNRVKNAEENAEKYEKIFNDILAGECAEQEIKDSIRGYLL